MKKRVWGLIIFMLLSGLAWNTPAQPDSPDGLTYKTGFSAMRKLGKDLYKSLKPQYQKIVHSEPINFETDVTPFVKLVEYPDEAKPIRAVFISVGFIDLVNNVAHAKAIDKIEKGYFVKYIALLGQESGEKSLQDLPNINDKRYWTEDVLNEQLSYFNQIVGNVVAIKLAHHYLGHFNKYSAQLADAKGNPVPINNLLTQAEWDAAVKAGVRNALDCGLGVDGLKSLYDAIDKMAKRPAWTAFFLPDKVKVSKLKSSIQKIEDAFFSGAE